jgi:pilus assembly protein CpaE
MAKRQNARLLLLDVDLANAGDLDLIRELKAGGIRIPIVALAGRGTELAALRAIRAGADDVLLNPIDPLEAREVFSRVIGTPDLTEPSQLGACIVFLHVAGGAGASTLAVNSAVALAGAGKISESCLLDLDIQYGNVASLLDLPPSSPIQDMIEDPGRLDREMLEGMMVRHESGVRVLTAPRVPLPLSAFDADTVATLMHIARRRFQYVVVDLPVALASWTDAVLKEASVIYVVCPPTVSAVHRYSQLMRLLHQEGLAELPIKVLVNRHQTAKRTGDISISQLASAIGRPVDHVIPNDYRLIAHSHSQGRPAARMKPSSKFVTALRAMLGADLSIEALKKQRRRWFGL